MRPWVIIPGGLISVLMLAACATPTVYQPAQTVSAVGFREAPLEDRRFRISFRTGDDAGPDAARDLALRRAAELTLERGHEWFMVADRHTEPARGGGGPRFSLGLGGADYGRRSAVGGGVGVGFGGASQSGYVATLEVVLGEGPRPGGVDVYDARDVLVSLIGA